MNKRKEINDKVVEWITNKVKTEYADDISRFVKIQRQYASID